MAYTFVFPSAAQMDKIEADLANRGKEGRVGLDLFPVEPTSTHNVRWSQEDNAYGLMKFRGLDGKPSRVVMLGENVYEYEPGVYGEYSMIDETEFVKRSTFQRPDLPIPVGDLVQNRMRLNIERQFNRMEYNVWDLLLNGTLNVPMNGPQGVTTYTDSYTTQTFSPTVPWATTASATPMADLQTIQQLYVGHGVNFGAGAKLYINQVTAFHVITNTNASDLFAFRNQYGATVINDLKVINDFFAARNLPSLVVYDEFFQTIPISGPNTTPNTYNVQKYIPNGEGVLVGQRKTGVPLGKWYQTPNSVNPEKGGGPYSLVKDFFNGINAPKDIPGRIEVHNGFNGGLGLHFPLSVVSLSGL
jgi:hypothetical protein